MLAKGGLFVAFEKLSTSCYVNHLEGSHWPNPWDEFTFSNVQKGFPICFCFCNESKASSCELNLCVCIIEQNINNQNLSMV